MANSSCATEPDEDPGVRGDAFKTLFVARLSYDTTEKDLEREFGRFGPIERIRIVVDSTAETNGTASESEAKPKQLKKKKKAHRGYAFVVYEREKDMKGTAFLPHPLHLPLSSRSGTCLYLLADMRAVPSASL